MAAAETCFRRRELSLANALIAKLIAEVEVMDIVATDNSVIGRRAPLLS